MLDTLLFAMPGGAELLILLFFFIIPGIFWLWALIDCAKSDFNGNNKIIWILVIIFVPFGFILYFLIGRRHKIVSTS